MNTVYLLLGSNEGERLEWLKKAAEEIAARAGTITRASSIYETAAWGIEEQPDFLNQVIIVNTPLSPMELLRAVQEIEATFGRQRTLKWGQRTLDIDILFFNDLVLDNEQLTIPHPHLQNRRFTLAPLAEIAPDLLHPVTKSPISDLLSECSDPLEARKLPVKR